MIALATFLERETIALVGAYLAVEYDSVDLDIAGLAGPKGFILALFQSIQIPVRDYFDVSADDKVNWSNHATKLNRVFLVAICDDQATFLVGESLDVGGRPTKAKVVH